MSLLTASHHIQKGSSKRSSPSSQSQPPLAPSTPSDDPEFRDPQTVGPVPSSPHSSEPSQPPQFGRPATQPLTPGTPATSAATLSMPPDSLSTATAGGPQTTPFYQQQHQRRLPPPSLTRVPPLEHVEIVPGLKITFHDAEAALADYRRLYSPYFPFVPLPYGLPAHELYHRQPLLFRILVQVALPQPPQMRRDARRWIREQLAHHIVVQEEKHIGLLQAALAHIAWIDLDFCIETKMTPILQLAIGLVVDLGLQRSPAMMQLLQTHLVNDSITAPKGKGFGQKEHGLDDMRAVLGCYYICALSSSLFRRTHAFPYNSYLDQCCTVLLDAREHESDELLVALVRLQQLVHRMYIVLPNPGVDPQPSSGGCATIFMSMAAMRRDLDSLIHSYSLEVKNNFFLRTNYHAVVSRLYEPAIYMRAATGATTTDPADAAERTACLWSCLQALRDFFEAQASIPADVLGRLPFTAATHLAFAIVTSMRLLFLLDDPGWDVVRARRSLDFVAVALRLEEQFQAAREFEDAAQGAHSAHSVQNTQNTQNAQNAQNIQGGAPTDTHGLGRKKHLIPEDSRSVLALLHDRMRCIRLWYSSKLSMEQRGMSDAAAASRAASTATSASEATSMPIPPFLPPRQQRGQPSGSFMDIDGFGPMETVGSSDEYDALFWRSVFSLGEPWDPMQLS